MDLIDGQDVPRHERELTLSTGSILGIFLGLVVLCGAFFGFGYNMGRKSAPTPLSLQDTATVAPETPAYGGESTAKPSAGSPLAGTQPATPPVSSRPARHAAPPPDAGDKDAGSAASTPRSTPTRTPSPSSAATVAASTPAPIVRQPAPINPSSLNPSTAVAPGSGTYMVQVAAVSHKEDADLLLGALRARGYSVSARSATGDSFIHVQVGPFHDKKEADAMRQRLLTDGYNAIVK